MITKKVLKICLGFVGLSALYALPFVLAQSDEITDSDGVLAYEEVYSAADSNGIVYIDFLAQATNESAGVSWFLGAYKFADGSLCVDLDRRNNILNNGLYYAVHYDVSGDNGALFLNLCSTSGVVLAQSENLLISTNAARYVFISAEDGIESTNTILLLSVPTAAYRDAAVLQLQSGNVGAPLLPSIAPGATEGADARSEDGSSEIIIREGLLFIAAGSDLWSSDGQGNGATNYPGGNSFSNFYDWVTGNTNGSSTNIPGGGGGSGGGGGDEPGGDDEDQEGIIYVDQARGNDINLGRAAASAKKTCRAGLAIVEPGDTIIIKSGNYNEDLNISGKNGIKVIIEGKVRL